MGISEEATTVLRPERCDFSLQSSLIEVHGMVSVQGSSGPDDLILNR